MSDIECCKIKDLSLERDELLGKSIIVFPKSGPTDAIIYGTCKKVIGSGSKMSIVVEHGGKKLTLGSGTRIKIPN